MEKYIEIKGARTNNLKNIHVKIPREKITALVGISGAGKTSLAFDTIYAEGYLRYIESISPYIRQFLDKIEKPPVESIEGLPPAISFKQKKPAKNPRSIVATSLDIYDYLRILYAKIADFFCPGCGKKIKRYSIDEIAAELLEHYPGHIHICFSYNGDVAFLVNRGYYFYLENGVKKRIDHTVKNKTIHVLIDRVETVPPNKSRLFEALDKSISLGDGPALIYHQNRQVLFPADLYCPTCDVHYTPPDERLFSFNSPRGACPRCNGFGDIQTLDPRLIFDPGRSLADGAARPFNSPATRHYRGIILENARKKGIDTRQPVKHLTREEIAFLMDGDETFGGIKGFFDWLKTKSYKVQARVFISRYTSYEPCSHCGGARLNDLARAFEINGEPITGFLALTVDRACDFVENLDPAAYKNSISPEVIDDIRSRLRFLVDTGLSYIQLDRPTFTLSRGEFQRINLAFILGSTLSDSLLILDQPSSDLHPHDYEKLVSFLTRLKESANTLLVIEHNRDIVRHCDHVLELGPLSGEKGGQVVFGGSRGEFFSETAGATLTGSHFKQGVSLKKSKQDLTTCQWLHFKNACAHNLKNFSVKIPYNAFTVIAGVSGAGKTTLLYDEMYLEAVKENHRPGGKKIKEIIFIDPGTQRIRSTTIVAGFFGVFTAIRELFARLKESRVHHYTPGHFSFNSPMGRCEKCKGKGHNEIEMQFLPPVNLECGGCGGTGFKPDVLKVKLNGRNIWQTLDLSVAAFIDAAGGQLPAPQRETLDNIVDNGLGYVKLGQRLSTLSAGELQRIKLVKYLNLKKTGVLFLVDEPTFGMHPYDIQTVKRSIDKLLENKNTVVAAEHNLDLIGHADYIIELGPNGGNEGGYVIFSGKPGDMIDAPGSITGNYLKKNLKST
jgi:excinuclease ABC subunit A